MAQDVGTGITIAFGTSGFTADILSVNGSGIERGEYETSHMGTTGGRTWSPTALVDEGTIELEFAFDPDAQPPINAATETITITFPLPDGGLTSATLIGSGFIKSWQWGAELEEKMTGSATVRWADTPAWTAST